MPDLRRFLTRRWLLAVLGGAALVFGLVMLHPYPRQSLFGPTIRGKPRCVWEAEVRRFGEGPPSFIDRTIQWFGVQRDRLSFAEVFDDSEMVPITVEMLGDADTENRLTAMTAITMFASLHDRSALPALHRLLASDEIVERAMAARTIWRINQDKRVIPVFLELLDQEDPILRHAGVTMIHEEVGATGAELFSCVAARVSDADPDVRRAVMDAMSLHGKRAVPILIGGLGDSNVRVRKAAAETLKKIGPDAAIAIPVLERRLADADESIRRVAADALWAIDGQRFAHFKPKEQ